MAKQLLIVLRHAPYGRLDAAEAVRYLNGATVHGLDAALLLLDDGVYLAKADQVPAPGWTELSGALAETLRSAEAQGGDRSCQVFAHGPALRARGVSDTQIIAGCKIIDDEAAANLLAIADASLIF